MSKKKRIALIGNGPVNINFSEVINNCDLVIRCNDATNIGKNTGHKTSVLCITNTGTPAQQFIDRKLIQQLPRFPELQEIWFPRDSKVHLSWLESLDMSFPRSELMDRGNEIIAANNLGHVPICRFSADLNKTAFERLASISSEPFICPSTGFLAFFYITQFEIFEQFEKLIFGFSFQMWDGHPAESERFFFHETTRTREDVTLFDGV